MLPVAQPQNKPDRALPIVSGPALIGEIAHLEGDDTRFLQKMI